ncbi:MAG: glycosyltransferase family 4 protein [Armatimonadota bacterium]|nr:glycosyltransferase family 4 protein [Armatimonadota bacterium]
MRTLVTTHLVPFPADTGGKAVSSHTLACLARIGDVDVCAFDPPWARGDGAARLRQVASRTVVLPLRRRPLVAWPLLAARRRPYYIWRDYSSAMRAQVEALCRDDHAVLFADTLQMAPYLSGLPGPKVLQQHNVESHLVDEFFRRRQNPIVRGIGAIEAGHLAAFERDQCNAFHTVVVLSDEDRQRLAALGVRAPMVVLPPGVEPVEPVAAGPHRRQIVHIGTGHWPPIADGLRWYLRFVHPLVRRALPAAETWLVGPPPKYLERTGAPEGVRVLGYVDDLQPVYHQTAAFIVPLLVGGGVRLKILHALARGLAVVATSAGAEGLGAEAGRHLLVADAPREFADAVVAVASDTRLRDDLGQAGRAFVLERFAAERRCAALAALLRDVAAGRVPGP